MVRTPSFVAAIVVAAATTTTLLITPPGVQAANPHSPSSFSRISRRSTSHGRRSPSSSSSSSSSPDILPRGADATNSAFTSLWYASSYTNGAQPPDWREGDTDGQTVIIGGANGTDNNSPVSTCPIAFIGGAAVGGNDETGWQSKAQVVDFDIVDLPLPKGNAVLPYYIERKDLKKIKRIVMVLQGAPRDTWRYANLMRYSGLCAVSNTNYDVNLEDYAVASPLLWNEGDLASGGASSNQLVWSGSQWANGGLAKQPESASYSTFAALDALITSFFDQSTYPALTSVVVAGHSAGGLLGQRYAMVRKKKSREDSNMKWWISNAGSYVWPVDSRPVPDPKTPEACKSDTTTVCEVNAACDAKKNEWPYGISAEDPKSMNVYARSRFEKGEKDKILRNYLDRRVQYTYALDDHGPGDTHCQAQYQGDSHLARGRNLAAVLATLDAPNHRVTYVANATHVDEELYIDYTSQDWIFNEGLHDERNSSASEKDVSATGRGRAAIPDSTSTTSTQPTSGAARFGVEVAALMVMVVAVLFGVAIVV